MVTAVGDFWAGRPWLDLVAAVLAGSALAVWAPLLSKLTTEERVGVYASAADVVAVVGGLGSVAVAAYVGVGGRRMSLLRQEQGGALRTNLAFFLIATAISAGTAWSAQIVEANGLSQLAWGMVVGSVLWCLLTALRQAWLFANLVAVSDQDAAESEPERHAAPAVSLAWRERASGTALGQQHRGAREEPGSAGGRHAQPEGLRL